MTADELDERVRALEAERLRPIPPRPVDDFQRRLDEFVERLEELGERHFGTKEASS